MKYLLVIIVILLGVIWFQENQNSQLEDDVNTLSNHMIENHGIEDSLKIVIDSLTFRTFDATRYEIAIERLSLLDSVAYNKFQECLMNIE